MPTSRDPDERRAAAAARAHGRRHGRAPASRAVLLRRRAVAVAVLVGLVGLVVFAVVALGGASGEDEPDPPVAGATTAGEGGPVAARPELPGGGRRIFPDRRVVAFYGNPQDRALGALGIGTPAQAARRLRRAARGYARKTRPVLPMFELISTVAARDPGADGLYRLHAPDAVIARYLRAARAAGAILVLDIQPGHADFLSETKRLARWLREPDVGLALDPEWHTPGAIPGTRIGSTTADDVNAVARYLAGVVKANDLPQKLFVIHQFTDDMIVDEERLIAPSQLAVTLNVDGFGTRSAKVSKYRDFNERRPRGTHVGFKLFYEEDVGLMAPRSVMALQPRPDLVVYE